MRQIQGKSILVRVSKGSSFQMQESNVVNITVVVQIFPWLEIFQTSLIFTFLCLKSITIIRDKEKQKLNWFEKFKPQHNH